MKHAPSILLGITHCPVADADRGQSLDVADIQDEFANTTGLDSAMAQIVHTLADKLFVSHPLDQGNSTWLTRQQLIDEISTMQAIHDTSAMFQSALTPQDEATLCYLVNELDERVSRHIECKEYAKAAATFAQMQQLESIDNEAVAHTIELVEERSRKHIEALAFNATTIAKYDLDHAKVLFAEFEAMFGAFEASGSLQYLRELFDQTAATIKNQIARPKLSRQKRSVSFVGGFKMLKQALSLHLFKELVAPLMEVWKGKCWAGLL